MKNVICMKWGTKFSPEYVNILESRVRKNVTGECRFVCFTEDASGLNPGVEVRPLPEMTGLEGRPERGWRKLTLFQEKLADLEGPALFLDLDVVVIEPGEESKSIEVAYSLWEQLLDVGAAHVIAARRLIYADDVV